MINSDWSSIAILSETILIHIVEYALYIFK